MSSLAQKSKDSPAITLGQAKEYDYILLMDQSGSMGDPSAKMKGRSRWEEAEEFTIAFARFADSVDDDGLTVINFNSGAQMVDGVKADAVKELFKNNRPSGSTILAPALELAFKKKNSTKKPAIILVVTDGEAQDPDETIEAIIRQSKKLDRDEELAIQFIQIGDDSRAATFLKFLDDGLQRKGAKFDIVNTLTREEAETLTIEQLLWQAIND